MKIEQLQKANNLLRMEVLRLRQDCDIEAEMKSRELAKANWELLIELDRRQEYITHLEQLLGHFIAVDKSNKSQQEHVS